MAKKNNQKANQISQPKKTEASDTVPAVAQGIAVESFRFQAIFLALVAILLYANTFSHEYAFDDMMAIVNNEYVQEGVSGIGKIMTTDAYQSYLEQRNGGNQLSGGRYRPLSLVSFAIEQQLLGINSATEQINGRTAGRNKEEEQKLINDMHIRHVINVLLYALCMVILLAFLRNIIFPGKPIAAFTAALLFAVHPLHTEVVANVKSRDEILSVIFICLTYLEAFKYRNTQTRKHLIRALISFFLALLSKEYAITTVLLLPTAFYIFRKDSLKASFRAFVPFLIPLALYLLMRIPSTSGPAEGADKDVMNYPYLYATMAEQLATKFWVLGYYVKLLLIPYPLSSDYSFHQIPYTDFSNPMVWVSIAIYTGMVVALGVLFLKRNYIAFALGLFLFPIALISNLVFNIGAPMGERLVFHSSIGFVIILGALFQYLADSIKAAKAGLSLVGGLMLVIVFASGFTVMVRNEDWKNNTTLFMKDVQTCPNSALTNTNAGSSCMNFAKATQDTSGRNSWMRRAIGYFTIALTINPKHNLARTNRGLCYYNTGNADSALVDWVAVKRANATMSNIDFYLSEVSKLFFSRGIAAGRENRTADAIHALQKSLQATPNIPDIWYNLGIAYVSSGDLPAAKNAFENTLKLAPGFADAQQRLSALTSGK